MTSIISPFNPASHCNFGMSLRDCFATAMLPLMLFDSHSYEEAAGEAYHIADAMLEARKEQ